MWRVRARHSSGPGTRPSTDRGLGHDDVFAICGHTERATWPETVPLDVQARHSQPVSNGQLEQTAPRAAEALRFAPRQLHRYSCSSRLWRSGRCSTAIALARLATIQALILSGLAEDLESELRNINRRSARPDHRDRQDSLTVVASGGRCIRLGSESRQAGRGWHEPGTRGAASDPDIRRA